MRAASLVLALSASALAACGSNSQGQSICDNTVPPPAACMSQCDPSPSAPNTCPAGYHCAADGFCDALCTPGGSQCGDGYECSSDGRCVGEGECQGIECNVTECQAMGMPETSISGTVYAPNGTLPLYGITVYIPNAPLPPMTEGAQCSRCADDLPGQPLARATTNEEGKFVIQGNVPDGADIPLVITSGKWRRQITIPAVTKCGDTALTDPQLTRLPKNKSEGDIPKIALTTGGADRLECLIRKLGIDDAEITTSSGTGRVHFFDGNGVSNFQPNWAGGAGALPASGTLWNSVNTLKNYDIVVLSCEGAQMGSPKTQTDLDAMKAYADLGGRVFASHWHNIWIGGYWRNGGNDNGNATNPNPVIASWRPIANWGQQSEPNGSIGDIIDEVNNPKGISFATWMQSPGVMGTTTRGLIAPIQDMRVTLSSIDPARAERWTYVNRPAQEPQNFQFTTPQDVPADQRCGKVVFSDMHVSGGGPASNDYPTSCGNNGVVTALTPQEKALAFMLFDLASCVGTIF